MKNSKTTYSTFFNFYLKDKSKFELPIYAQNWVLNVIMIYSF